MHQTLRQECYYVINLDFGVTALFGFESIHQSADVEKSINLLMYPSIHPPMLGTPGK